MRIFPIAAAAALASTAILSTAGAASAAPDTSCMRAGISTLRDAGLLSSVARNGVDLTFAVQQLGVTVRPGADISGVPNPVPFSLLLADHRAGADSLFIYPWC